MHELARLARFAVVFGFPLLVINTWSNLSAIVAATRELLAHVAAILTLQLLEGGLTELLGNLLMAVLMGGAVWAGFKASELRSRRFNETQASIGKLTERVDRIDIAGGMQYKLMLLAVRHLDRDTLTKMENLMARHVAATDDEPTEQEVARNMHATLERLVAFGKQKGVDKKADREAE